MFVRLISSAAVSTAIGTMALTSFANAAPAPAATSATSAAMPSQAAAFAKAPVKASPIDWSRGVDFAQNHSDLLPHPGVRFGKLPNGMTYAIARNQTPPGTAAVQLRFAAGSLMETDRQRGLAHFLEHMAFQGSTNVGDNEMVKILERHGLSFGADTNAGTGPAETIYKLNISKVNEETLRTVLFLLRELSGNLNLKAESIERERGVILSEERLRDVPEMDMARYVWQKQYTGQKIASRMPIGTVEVIKNAQRADFVDFYDAFYRPELATLVVMGDIDPQAVEQQIKAKFGDWKPRAPGPIRKTDFGRYVPKPLQADTYVARGLGNNIAMSWARPAVERYETVDTVYRDLLASIALDIVNERLLRLLVQGDSKFMSATVQKDAWNMTADEVSLAVQPKPGQDKEAYVQAYSVLRQFLLHGAEQAELDRVLVSMDASYRDDVAGEATQHTGALVGSVLTAVAKGKVMRSASQKYALFRSLRAKLTLAQVNETVKGLLQGRDGPFLWHNGEDLNGLDKVGLLAAYQQVQDAKIERYVPLATKPWPYTSFAGTPAAVVKRRQLAQIGTTELTYANGIKVLFKPTTFDRNSVAVRVRFEGGLKSIAPADNAPVVEAREVGMVEGGLGKLDPIEMRESLNGKKLGYRFDIGDDASLLRGGAVAAEFPALMQVLMAYATDAAYRPEPFKRYKQSHREGYARCPALPDCVLKMHIDGLLHSGDSRFGIRTPAEVDKVSLENMKTLFERQLKATPVEITVVGDISEEQVEREIAKTFAKLAARPAQPLRPESAGTVSFPTKNLQQSFRHEGRADQAIGYIAWPTTDEFSSPRDSAGLELLSQVLTGRMIDQLRQEQALTYSPRSRNVMSESFKGFGYISASVEVKPERLAEFFKSVDDVVEALKTQPVTEDELQRARQPVLAAWNNADRHNGFWLDYLSGYTIDTTRFDYYQGVSERVAAVSAADLQRLARQYLVDAKALKLEVKPNAEKTLRAAPQ